MAVTVGFNTPPDTTLLSIYKEKVIASIEAELMKDIRPIVRKAAEIAASELEVQIQQMFDHAKNGQVIAIHVKMTEKPLTR